MDCSLNVFYIILSCAVCSFAIPNTLRRAAPNYSRNDDCKLTSSQHDMYRSGPQDGDSWTPGEDKNCWHECGEKGDSCPEVCGENGWCCRKDFTEDNCPDKARNVSTYGHHTCVIEPDDVIWTPGEDKNCWHECGEKGDSCPEVCGENGWCCRKDFAEDNCPDEARKVATYEYHSCVIKSGSIPACPPGFKGDIGDVKGPGLINCTKKDSITDCGEECNKDSRCNSFSYSSTTQNCVIYEQINPTDGKYKDFSFCKKKPVRGELCNRDCTQNPQDNWICAFDFTLSKLSTNSQGRFADGLERSVLVYNGVLPGPTIVVCQGDNIIVNLRNELSPNDEALLRKSLGNVPGSSTTLHFHGIRHKEKTSSLEGYSDGGSWSDGVPMVTECPILPSESFSYAILGSGAVDDPYNNAPAGTYWYHSHLNDQRVNGAGGKLIIMPRTKDDRFDVDIPENSLILQEWYNNLDQEIATNLLVNGKGKQHKTLYKCFEDDCIKKYKKGQRVTFVSVPNPNYHIWTIASSQANYEVFNIEKPGQRYRFRIVGASGEWHPVRISIEDHKFTAISADSVDIEPVPDLDCLYISIGERYDIVIDTKSNPRDGFAYKISLVTDRNQGGFPYCSVAWLKYPKQKVDKEYEIPDNCSAMFDVQFTKVLNPVPTDTSIWGNSPDSSQTEYIFPINLTARVQAKDIHYPPINTQYISMPGQNFKGKKMAFPKNYPDVPFLFQSPTDTERCGVVCKEDLDTPTGEFKTICNKLPNPNDECQHVLQQPLQSPDDETKHWFEIVMTNCNKSVPVAHPIHHHGGWFNIVGMGQFDSSISHEDIEDMDKNCDEGVRCLPRNITRPVFKDTIQVPLFGYVIFRAPIDNAGASLVHCHIHSHNVVHGMAMVFQIGEPHQWSIGRNNKTAHENRNHKCFPNYL